LRCDRQSAGNERVVRYVDTDVGWHVVVTCDDDIEQAAESMCRAGHTLNHTERSQHVGQPSCVHICTHVQIIRVFYFLKDTYVR